MKTTIQELEALALRLTASDRSELAERLMASLELDPDVEKAWEQIADQREAAWTNGTARERSLTDVLARQRAKLGG